MIRFYFHPTPNPAKVALFLEETGLPYEVVPVDTGKGQQHTPEFRAINPNGKVPAIVDTDGLGGAQVTVFDSSAILLYLGVKTGRFMGPPSRRANCFRGCFSSPRGWVPILARPYTSSAPLRRSCPTPSTGIGAKQSVTTPCSTSD